ncbi:MAG: rhodanese-like domain-containing protein [Halocynthiibacter sp.]
MTNSDTENAQPERGNFLTRRRVLVLAGAAAVTTVAGVAYYRRMPFEGDTLDPVQALKMVESGEIILIDIRRPDEWEGTGIGKGALPLDMRRDDFIDALDAIMEGKRDSPVALICAAGVRSNRMSQRLADAGFERVIDIPEGMLGSRAGPGWIERGLPLVQP